jgi:hypothetical protein
MTFVDKVACAREIQKLSGASLFIATNIYPARASDNVYISVRPGWKPGTENREE